MFGAVDMYKKTVPISKRVKKEFAAAKTSLFRELDSGEVTMAVIALATLCTNCDSAHK